MKFSFFAVALLLVASFAAAQQVSLVPVANPTPSATTTLVNPNVQNAAAACQTVGGCPAPANASAPAPAPQATNSTLKPAIVLGAPAACNCQLAVVNPACGCPAPLPVYVAPEIKDPQVLCCVPSANTPCAANQPLCPQVVQAPEIKDVITLANGQKLAVTTGSPSALPSTCCAVTADNCGNLQVRCAPVETVVPEIGTGVKPEVVDRINPCPCAAAQAQFLPSIAPATPCACAGLPSNFVPTQIRVA